MRWMNVVRSLVAAAVMAAAGAAGGQDSIESRSLSNIRQVTSGMQRAGEGYFSPDGQSIIYQAVPLDYPFYQIYTQPLLRADWIWRASQAALHRPRADDVQLLLA